MALLPILKYPDQRLRQVSKPVTCFDEDLAVLVEDLKQTMVQAPGAGLAAPQVDRLLRIIVVDFSDEENYGQNVVALINPQITASEGEQIYQEGCLSVVDLRCDVCRSDQVTVEAQDISGQTLTISAQGRRAVILQHEIDHLDGVLFLDHISHLKREMYRKKLLKTQKMAKNS
jgi:peptide deformylase